ncbi:MAG: type IV pilus modification PilV family protein [Actinomycetota bacterium]
MTALRKFDHEERGFTLVEMMASILVFAIMTLGMVPLLASSMRGATVGRAATVGKNAAVEEMERIRGFPYHISYAAQNQKVDLLDLFFPNMGAGYDSATGVFTTTCTTTTLDNPACPRSIPSGYTITVAARFITPNTSGGYDAVTPPAGYQWDSATGADFPPAQFMDFTVTSSWTVGARARNYSVQSYLGDRKSVGESVRGTAKVDYGVQVITTFEEDGDTSQLTAQAGIAESRIESRLLSTADQLVRAGRLQLVELVSGDTEVAQTLGEEEGATATYHASPDQTPAPNVDAGSKILIHEGSLEGSLDIAGLDDTQATDLSVAVSNEVPSATGNFRFLVGLGEEEGGEPSDQSDFWVVNQRDTNDTFLRFDPLRKLLSLRATGGQTLTGGTSAVTGAIDAGDRRVQTDANVSFEKLLLLPALLDDGGATSNEVVRIENFTASVSCKSTANSATAESIASWSADLFYYRDDVPSDGLAFGGYASIEIGSGEASDPLAGFGPGVGNTNPLVYEGDPLEGDEDIYLFDDPSQGRKGYLKSWSSRFGTTATESANGEETSANIDAAIFIHTNPTNPNLPDSGLQISIGKLSCEALDARQ